LVTRTPTPVTRPAAVSASTVFAIALAIVAGLIFAWLFKIFLFDKPKTQKPVDNTRELTVAARNLYDKTEVKSIDVKKIRVSPEDYDKYAKSGKKLLDGNKPVGRVTIKPVLAEEPFYEEDMYPFAYPESLLKRIRPGMRPVIVTVPAKEAMVQVGDAVDVYLTMSNDALGAGGTGTALVARGAEVVARFGTTRPGAQPVNNTVPREYTLEVTPYRYALIELAKTLGGKFSLGVTRVERDEEGKVALPPEYFTSEREKSADRVTGYDLRQLFGIVDGPPPIPPFVIEKYVGISEAGARTFPDYVPASRAAGPGAVEPAGSASSGGGIAPVGNTGGGKGIAPSPAGDFGFRTPGPKEEGGCPTCGKKQ
jgi:Flp pilus assembly protein CpaB